jgi:hypothetical protein
MAGVTGLTTDTPELGWWSGVRGTHHLSLVLSLFCDYIRKKLFAFKQPIVTIFSMDGS